MIFWLLILFAIIAIAVLKTAPEPKTPAQKQTLFEVHEAILYFFDAELMAKQLCPDPTLRWSHDLIDAHTGCTAIGNGVWYARGTMKGPAGSSPSSWEAYFVPDGEGPLYVRAGNLAAGDANAALRRAGYATPEDQSMPGGK